LYKGILNYAISDSPFGPFERIGKILQQDPSIATGAGHHSVIRIPGTEKYYIVYHRRPLGQKDRNSREVCIDKMEFDEIGFIKQLLLQGKESRLKKPGDGVTKMLLFTEITSI